jgi:hypothetical protein
MEVWQLIPDKAEVNTNRWGGIKGEYLVLLLA